MVDADVGRPTFRSRFCFYSFFRFMKPLIETGHVYLAKPPLYKLSRGKNPIERIQR